MSMKNNDKSFAEAVGKRIRFYRKSLGLTIEELSDRCDPPFHYNYVGSVERGKYNLSLSGLLRISKGLNVSVCDLVKMPEFNQAKPNRKRKLNRLLALLKDFSSTQIEFIMTLAEEIKAKRMDSRG